MLLVDGSGLPLSIDVDSARPGEVTLIEPLLEQTVVARLPNRLIYDRAADSDPLRARLAALAALVRDKLALDPLSGQLFVFRSSRGDRVKLLFWDGDGYGNRLPSLAAVYCYFYYVIDLQSSIPAPDSRATESVIRIVSTVGLATEPFCRSRSE